MLVDPQMCAGEDDQAQGVDYLTYNDAIQLALSIFVMNVLSHEIDEANTITQMIAAKYKNLVI
jgi:hypothetical protein